MNIKTLSDVSCNTPYLSHPLIRKETTEALTREIWLSLEQSFIALSPEKASLALDLGEHQKDPVRILAMLLLNLSRKDVLEFREALGIPELTRL